MVIRAMRQAGGLLALALALGWLLSMTVAVVATTLYLVGVTF